MSSDYDKHQWQAEQAARDAALEKQRDKERKTRERAARNAQRKLERLHRKLLETGDITDFENEFGQSVLQRLDKFGSAFNDLEKGRPGDALSFAQKSVVAAMNKKVKALKKKAAPDNEADFDDGYERTADRWKNQNIADKESGKDKRSSFGSKKTPKFTPRVRHIEDDFVEETPPKPSMPKVSAPKVSTYDSLPPDLKNKVPYLPQYKSNTKTPNDSPIESPNESSGTQKPFLRLVK